MLRRNILRGDLPNSLSTNGKGTADVDALPCCLSRWLACAAFALPVLASGCASLCPCATDPATDLSNRLSGAFGSRAVSTRADFSVKTLELRHGTVTVISGQGDYVEPFSRLLASEAVGIAEGLNSVTGLFRFFGVMPEIPDDRQVLLFRRGSTVGWATDADESELRVLREWATESRSLFRQR
jgi:hypothetical protein